MNQRQPPDFAGRNSNVGNLEGHADHERKIGKVKKVGFSIIGEFQSPLVLGPTIALTFGRTVVKVGIA